jgi:hypothetical protein
VSSCESLTARILVGGFGCKKYIFVLYRGKLKYRTFLNKNSGQNWLSLVSLHTNPRCHGTGRAARAPAAFTTACCPTPMHTSEPGGRGVGSCSIAGARLSAGVPEARGPMRRSTCAEGGRSRTRARSFSLSRSLARSLAPSLSLPLSICAAGQVRMAASQIVLCEPSRHPRQGTCC